MDKRLLEGTRCREPDGKTISRGGLLVSKSREWSTYGGNTFSSLHVCLRFQHAHNNATRTKPPTTPPTMPPIAPPLSVFVVDDVSAELLLMMLVAFTEDVVNIDDVARVDDTEVVDVDETIVVLTMDVALLFAMVEELETMDATDDDAMVEVSAVETDDVVTTAAVVVTAAVVETAADVEALVVLVKGVAAFWLTTEVVLAAVEETAATDEDMIYQSRPGMGGTVKKRP